MSSVRPAGISVDFLGPGPGWFSSLPLAAAFVGLALGSVVILGRAFDLAILQSLLPGMTEVTPGAAGGFLLGGTSLLLFGRQETRWWSRVLAAGLLVVMTVAWIGLVLAELGVVAVEPVGLGFQATFGFTLLGAALLFLTSERLSARMVGAELALAAAFVGWAGLILYTYSAGLVPWESISSMVFTSLGVTVLGLGTAAADEAISPFRVLRSDGPGGALARYLVPFVAIIPFILGWIHLAGQRAAWYEPTLGVAALTISSSVLFAFLVVTYASRLDRSEERRRSVERVLRESSEFNTQIVASAQEGIVVVDEHQRCVLWNPFMERLTGLPEHDILGKPLMQTTSLGVLTQLEAMEQALAGRHVEGDVEQPTSSGNLAWLLVSHTPLKTAAGGIRGAIVTVHDITELKRVEQALRETQKRTATALAALDVGVWEIDVTNGAVIWTENVSPLLASSPDSIRALSDIVDRIHPDDRATTVSAIEQAIATGGDFDVESRVVLPDGAIRWMRTKGRVVHDASFATECVIGVTSDVTGRHVLERQYLQAQKMEAIGQLAGGVAHDFNNLLTAILGYAGLVREGIGDPVGQKNIDEVIKAAMRASALTRQLLAFSRPETPETVVLNANDVVLDLLDMLRRLIGEHVVLTTDLAERLQSIRTVRGHLEQVIVNLVVNARDAMPKGGHIRIETANAHIDLAVSAHDSRIPPGDYVRISVSDTGVGISDEVRPHLFRPFFTTKGRDKGTGLGLTTVHGIVTAAHGYIAVESEVGKGAAFTVYWPSSAHPVLESLTRIIEPSHPDAPSIATRVLIIEDEEAVRYLSRVILERAGHTVFEAATLRQAETVLSEVGSIDLLVSDVILPGGRGPELFARLRIQYPALRVVFMSGYVDDDILSQTQLDPAMRFIQKPFTAEALLGSVTSLLGSAGAHG
jgi:PAS domain S-box-containing protein